MNKSEPGKPELVVEYVDPVEGFKGWLAIDKFAHELCAGGIRVQKGLTRECIEKLAATMTLKMRIAGIRADGAKCGIDYDPASPGKEEALFRFIRAIRPFIRERYSMGPDMNTTMPELDRIVARLDIPSIKIAVAHTQGLDYDNFMQRIDILAQPAGHAVLGRLRAGSGLASACLGVLDYLDISYPEAKVVIQGFGGLASGAAYCLDRERVRIIAAADREKCLFGVHNKFLEIEKLLQQSANGLIPDTETTGSYGKSKRIYDLSCDIFIPAAIEKSITAEEARSMQVKAVVCGANLAITPEAEHILHERGILVIPDLVAGCGGSLSMEGLFGPVFNPSVQDVLRFVDNKMRSIVRQVLERSKLDKVPTREAALRICAERTIYPGTRPYGSLDEDKHQLCILSHAYQCSAGVN